MDGRGSARGIFMLGVLWGSVSFVPACIEQRCYENLDCPSPKICSAAGVCVYACTRASDCGSGFICVDHVCKPVSTGPINCPDDMVPVAGAYCVDRYEASRQDATSEREGSDQSRSMSVAGVVPWQVSSNGAAEAACAASGKRLCTPEEWGLACRGPDDTTYGYGNTYDPVACNGIDTFGRTAFHLTPTGDFPRCTNAWGVFDMNGNLWEHVAGGNNMTIRGGAFNCSDSATLHRCDYIPGNWTPSARGFRCCKAPDPPEEVVDVDGGFGDGDSEGGGCVVDGAGGDGDASADGSTGDGDANEEAADPFAGGDAGTCPDDMIPVGASCIDRYEASRPDATATSQGIDSTMAVSQSGVLPWYVSYMTPAAFTTFTNACAAAGKRLCRPEEFLEVCTGAERTTYGYGSNAWLPSICNSVDTFCETCCAILGTVSPCPRSENCGYSSLLSSSYTPETCFITEPYSATDCHVCFHIMPTGSFPYCTNDYGAYDVNGNVWEIVPSAIDARGYEVRGGAFNCGSPSSRFACSFNASWYDLYAGFRCCKDRGAP